MSPILKEATARFGSKYGVRMFGANVVDCAGLIKVEIGGRGGFYDEKGWWWQYL